MCLTGRISIFSNVNFQTSTWQLGEKSTVLVGYVINVDWQLTSTNPEDEDEKTNMMV